MPREIPKIEKRHIALVHVAKTKLGLSEESYRDMLASVGVASSKDLNTLQFEEIMSRFEAAGFVSKNQDRRKSFQQNRQAQEKRAGAPRTALLMGKVGAILADTGLPWTYADGVAKKMFGLDSVRFCNETQLWKVVAALSIYQKRKKK
jgi:phage gp16-like protein